MSPKNLTLRQQILLNDAEHEHSGKQFTFRVSVTANEHIDRIIATEKVNASVLLRVLLREGAKSFLGFDIEEEQQAPAE